MEMSVWLDAAGAMSDMALDLISLASIVVGMPDRTAAAGARDHNLRISLELNLLHFY